MQKTKIQIRSRIDESLHEKLVSLGKEMDCEQATVIRRMIMLGVDTYHEKMGKNVDEDVAKRKLLRAERFAIYSNTLQLLIASERVSTEKMEEIKRKARALLAEKWQFGDDPIDTLLLAKTGDSTDD